MKKILVIEDNDAIRENTSEMLELNHYDVLTAVDGAVGFELAKTHAPDLILCDIMMPRTDGKAFLERARQDETVQRIPVIFFSAGSAQNLQQEIIKKADAFIKKPFSEADLLSTIKIFLDGR